MSEKITTIINNLQLGLNSLYDEAIQAQKNQAETIMICSRISERKKIISEIKEYYISPHKNKN